MTAFQAKQSGRGGRLRDVVATILATLAVVALVHRAYSGSSSSGGTEYNEISINNLVRDEVVKAVASLDGSSDAAKVYPPTKTLRTTERKRVLVTGGAGFVGSHLVDRLMTDGHEVTVLDNFFTGRKQNIEHWIGHTRFQLLTHDVVEPVLLEVDQIYHLACPASPPHYQFNPIKTIKTSVEGTLNMLGLARRVGARILFTSTSEVYGDPLVHPQNEEYFGNVNTIGPRACYDEGKRVAETMCYAYQRQVGVDVRVARIFNTYGTRMHPNDGRVVSNFIIQALQGEDLTIYGDGTSTRSFQYVDDLVEGLVRLMASDYSSPVNIGNPTEVTIKELALKIRSTVGAKYKKKKSNSSKIVHLKATKDDPKKRKPDISTAYRVLKGWKPLIGIDLGLDKTISYFKEELEKTGSFKPIQPSELTYSDP